MQFKTLTSLSVLLIGLSITCRSASIENQILPKNEYSNYNLALEAIFGMGLRLHALLDNNSKENFVVSPVSTVAILAQLMLGAEGPFRDELYGLLSLPKGQENYNVTHFNNNKEKSKDNYCLPYGHFHLQLSALLKKLKKRTAAEHFTLNLNNALFYNENIELRSDFMKRINLFYDTELKPLNFYTDTSSIINEWAANHTNGLITSIMAGQLSPVTASIFLNSIYFHAEWEHKFSDELNTVDVFYTQENTTVNTTYMLSYLSDIPYYKSKNFKMVCLPYLNRELGMYIILPHEDNELRHDINKFVQTVDPQEVLDSLANLKNRDVVVKIPKISLTNTLRILKPLQKFSEIKVPAIPILESRDSLDEIKNRIDVYKNYTEPINKDLYLSGAAKGINLKISDIVQQMVFSINENGTEAAAVTSSIIDYIGGSKRLVLTRPFSFFIKHEATNATIFWGTISDPSQN